MCRSCGWVKMVKMSRCPGLHGYRRRWMPASMRLWRQVMGPKMLDGIVCQGTRPWLPCPAANNLDVWHADDVPTVGTFECHSQLVLFTAVGDVASEDTTVWAYLPAKAQQRHEFEKAEFETVADMHDFVRAQFADRHAVFACADNFV